MVRIESDPVSNIDSLDNQPSGWEEVAMMADQMHQNHHEDKKLEHDMINARDAIDYEHRDRLQKQRTQEIIERKLNDKLLKNDQLDLEALDENSMVEKRSIDYEGTGITVYNLRGIPFSLLSTTIDYRKGGYHQGSQTYREVMDHPEIWLEHRDRAMSTSNFGTNSPDARGDTISASYYNSESNIENHVHGELIYGFSHVDADSIISISNTDGSTGNTWGGGDTKIEKGRVDAIERLEGPGGDGVYNEVCLRRYSENGFPKTPDYIIVEDNKISEAAKRHAKFFNIPILNIDNQAYHEKMIERGEAIIESIDGSDSYKTIDQKYSELYSMSEYKGREGRPSLELVDVGSGIPSPQFESYIGREHKDTINLELSKRLELINDSLQNAISAYNEAISNKSRYSAEDVFPDFDHFSVRLQDVSHENGWYDGGDHYLTGISKKPEPGDCSCIVVEFQLKNSSRKVKTVIHDGKRRFKVDEALERAYISPAILADSDSDIYDTLSPVVRQYFDARSRYANL